MSLRPDDLLAMARRHAKTLLPFMTPAKALNASLALAELESHREVCRSRPFMFRIDPCTACNLRCPSCSSHTAVTAEKRVMSLADFRTVIDRVHRHALRASLYDMGEPLMNRDFYRMAACAGARGVSTLASTNFNLFDEGDLDDLFASRLTVLEPCLDGFTQESYATYRVRGDVEKVKAGIRAVMERKRATGAKWPLVDVQVVLFDHIMHELPQIERFLKGVGVDAVTYRQENLGFNSAETPLADKAGTRPRCFWLYFGMMVRPDGRVYPCCGLDFDRFSYGSLLEQSLDEIWNNEYYRFSRRLFTPGPDLPFDERMRGVPCLTCHTFRPVRGMRAAS